jgi:O-antigen/teichoic acid export membrane protein
LAPLSDAGNLDERAQSAQFWRTGRWWRRAAHTALVVWGATGLAFLGTVVAARALGPAGYGSVVLAVGVASLIATFLDLTLEEAVVHHGSRLFVAGDWRGLHRLLSKALTLDITLGVVISGAVVLLAAPVADLVSSGELAPSLVRLAALSTLVATADSTTSAVLLVSGHAHLRAWTMAATNFCRLVGVLVAVQLGGPEAVILSYVIAGALGSTVQGLIAWRVGWRTWVSAPGSDHSPVDTPTLLRFGVQSSMATSLGAIEGSLIPVMLGNLAGTSAVGVFRVATLPVVAADTASGPLRLLLLPEQARLAAEGRYGQLRRAMTGYTLLGLGIGVCGAIVGLIALPWLIPLLYTSKFDSAVLPAQILLITAVFHMSVAWGKTLPAAIGRPGVRTIISATMIGLTVTLLLVLGGEGSKGAAIAYSAATTVTAILVILTVHVVLKRAERDTALARDSAAPRV